MNRKEAQALIAALEDGHSFEFSNYHAGTREVLEYDRSEKCFQFLRHDAYDPEVQKENFSRAELLKWLQQNFSFQDFKLPPE